MSDRPHEVGLVALVAKSRTEAVAAALREEGVYDDRRSIVAHDEDRVAVPLSAGPDDTRVDAIVERSLPVRRRGLADRLRDQGWSPGAIERAPGSWAVVGEIILVDVDGVPHPEAVARALLELHGEAHTVLARGGIEGPRREPTGRVLAGTGETETVHVEHGTRYALDLAEVMFSPGNKAERARMGRVVSPEEHVFDMFAGVGYFALPMARAGATVTAAEINPTAHRYLVENARLNGVQDRLAAHAADCRTVDVSADRVVLGHFEAHEYLEHALATLSDGGMLHVHTATPDALVPDRPLDRLYRVGDRCGRSIEVDAVRRVKGYSEGVSHLVIDASVAADRPRPSPGRTGAAEGSVGADFPG